MAETGSHSSESHFNDENVVTLKLSKTVALDILYDYIYIFLFLREKN